MLSRVVKLRRGISAILINVTNAILTTLTLTVNAYANRYPNANPKFPDSGVIHESWNRLRCLLVAFELILSTTLHRSGKCPKSSMITVCIDWNLT